MTKDGIIKLAREAGMYAHKEVQPELLSFANLVAAAEREACAKLCDRLAGEVQNQNFVAVDNRKICAKAIRARGD